MSKKQWPMALKMEYFEYCQTLPPSYLLNLHSTAILHLKKILQPIPMSLLDRLSSILYKPPSMPLSLLSDPVELIRKQHLLPSNFYSINRADIKSTPRLNVPSIRLIYKETPGLLVKQCTTKNLKDNCLNNHSLYDGNFIRVILGKIIPRKISSLKKRSTGQTKLLPKSPLGYSCVEIQRRDSKMDDVFGLIKSKSLLSLRFRNDTEGKLNNEFNSDRSLITPGQTIDSLKEFSGSLSPNTGGFASSSVWKSVSSIMSKLAYNNL